MKEMKNPHESSGNPFVIRCLDTAEYRPGHQIPPTVFRSDSFLYLRDGEVLADAGTEPFLVCAGQFLLIPEGTPRHFLKSPNLGILYCRTPTIVAVPEEDRGFVASLADKLFREQHEGEQPGEMLLCTLDLLLKQIDSLAESGRDRAGNPLCGRFLDMVFDRGTALTGVSAYAGKLGVSPNHLNRVVKTGTGRSAGEWIDISRITLSKFLLRQSGMPVIDIASRCGFDDQSYFSRFFRKHTGMTPSEFRAGSE